MGRKAGEVVYKFLADERDFDRGVGRVEGRLGKLGRAAGPAIGVVGGLATGAAVAGGALFALGSEADGMSDAIVRGTGASGRALAGLEDEARDVFGRVPIGMREAGTAVADMNTQFGFVGDELENASVRMLDFVRLTEGDLTGTVQGVGRVMGDWGIANTDLGQTLDTLLTASQASGAGVDQLAGSVVQFGAPLRQMGFGFEESLALFGKWHQEGVNTEIVLSGLRQGISRMAAEGKDIPSTMSEVFDSILNAGSASEATTLAIKNFGAEAGPDLAAAIREGRFGIDDLVATLQGSEGAVDRQVKATDSFGESWGRFRNRLINKVAPVAERFFDRLGEGMSWLSEQIDPFLDKLEEEWPNVVAKAEEVWAEAGPVIIGVVEGIRDVIIGVVDIVQALWNQFGDDILATAQRVWPQIQQVIGAVMQQIKGIVDVVAGIMQGDWGRAWDGIKGMFGGAWDEMVAKMRITVDIIVGIGEALWGLLVSIFGDLVSDIGEAIGELVDWVADLPDRMIDALGDLSSLLIGKGRSAIDSMAQGFVDAWNGAVGWVRALPSKVVTAIGNVSRLLWEKGRAVIGGFGDGWVNAWNGAVGWLRGLPGRVLGAVPALGRTLFDAGATLIGGFGDGWVNAWNGAVGWLRGLGTRILNAVPALGRTLFNAGKTVVGGLGDGFLAGWDLARNWLLGLAGRVKSTVGSIGNILWSIGKSIINGLWSGMKSAWNSVTGWLGGLGGKIKSLKGPIDKDRVMLVPQGKAIMAGLGMGMQDAFDRDVEPALRHMTNRLARTAVPGRRRHSMGLAAGAARSEPQLHSTLAGIASTASEALTSVADEPVAATPVPTGSVGEGAPIVVEIHGASPVDLMDARQIERAVRRAILAL